MRVNYRNAMTVVLALPVLRWRRTSSVGFQVSGFWFREMLKPETWNPKPQVSWW